MSETPTLERDVVDFLESVSGGMSLVDIGLAAARANHPRYPSLALDPEARAVETSDFLTQEPRRGVPVRLYRPPTARILPLLVWFQGGGFALGSFEAADQICRYIAAHAECAVASVLYRLAPENPFPAAVEDAVAATEWILTKAVFRGVDPGRAAIGGESSGANLAAVVAHIGRTSPVRPRLQVLVYPPADWSGEWPSMSAFAEGYFTTRRLVEWFRDMYLPNPEDALDPRAAPLRFADFSDLPAALVITAECDPLRDAAEAYAERLRKSGGTVILHRQPGTIHPFLSLAGALHSGRSALNRICRTLMATFQLEPSSER